MAVTETELRADEMERGRLEKAISEVEATLAATPPASRSPVFKNFLENARGRVAVLDKKIKEDIE